MSQQLEETGLQAVDEFINTWNSRDPDRWAASLNYPHVRPSPFGDIVVSATAERYAAQVDFDKVVATGWDHSEWDYKRVLHTSPDKIHVAGQWSRYNAAGEIIHTNPVVYIVTRVEGHWGIQSRFGSDFAADDVDTSGLESRGFKLVKDFYLHLHNGKAEAAAELLNYPHFEIQVGHLDQHLSIADYRPGAASVEIESLLAVQTGSNSMNVAATLLMDSGEGAQRIESMLNLTIREHHLGIQAWSYLDPSAEPD